MSTLAFPLHHHEAALGRSASLSALVHIVLLAVMILGVRWQSHRPEVVEVELWEAPSVRTPPAPRVVVPPPAPPKVEAPPRVEKPVIAVREKPKPKPEPKAKAKPEPQPKPKADAEFQKRLREQALLEQKALEAQQRERALNELLARAQVDARGKAVAAWQDKIRAKIRGNIILPQGIVGNPEAIFDVTQLPTGEILNVVKRKSSGHAGYDEAVERAILKSSPLPKPDSPGIFERQLKLNFHPLD